MGDKVNKKFYDPQSLLYGLIDTYTIQSKYMVDPEAASPRRLINNNILKNCVRQEETLLTRNKAEDMHLFYLKQAVYSALVPEVRLFKVVNTRSNRERTGRGSFDKSEVVEIEFPKSLTTNNFLDAGRAGDILNDIARPVYNRYGQIGLKSFEWNYVGTNPDTSERDIRAKLSLTMDGLGALSSVRTNSRGQNYRILDLIIQADCFKAGLTNTENVNEPEKEFANAANELKTDEPLRYDSGCYEILVEAGYLIDDDNIEKIIQAMGIVNKSGINWSKESTRNLLKKMSFKKLRSCMYLNVVDHTFSFEQNGKVECTVEYVARSIVADRNPEANILFNEEQKLELERIQLEIEKIKSNIEKIESGEIQNVVVARENVETGTFRNLQYNAARDSGARTEEELEDIRTLTTLENQKIKLKNRQDEREEIVSLAKDSFLSNVIKELMLDPKIKGIPSRRVFTLQLDDQASRYFNSYLEVPTENRLLVLRDYLQFNGTKVVVAASDEDLEEAPDETETTGLDVRVTQGGLSGLSLGAKSLTVPEKTPVTRTTPYVYFGDLLDAIISHAGSTNFEDYRYVLSNITIRSPLNVNDVSIPIGGIPISIDLLRSIIEKEFKANKKQKYTLMQFINLMMRTALKESIGRQAVKTVSNNNKRFKTTAFIHYVTKTKPDPTITEGPEYDVVSLNPQRTFTFPKIKRELIADDKGEAYPGTSKPTIEFFSAESPESVLRKINNACGDEEFLLSKSLEILNIIVVHESANYKFSDSVYGDLEKDSFQRYIPHFAHGQPYGLIKKIALNKTDIPLYKETRFENLGDDNPDTYLTNLYNATFEMIGNDLMTLGSYVYFDPIGLSPDGSYGKPNDPSSLSYIMGIGGVYLVTKISHRITPGNYTTIVDALWEHRGALKEGSSGNNTVAANNGVNDGK